MIMYPNYKNIYTLDFVVGQGLRNFHYKVTEFGIQIGGIIIIFQHWNDLVNIGAKYLLFISDSLLGDKGIFDWLVHMFKCVDVIHLPV